MANEEYQQIEKLCNAETFPLWKLQINIFFKSYALDEIVEGSVKIEQNDKEEVKKDWIRKDARAQKIIITTIDKKAIMYIINCKTSYDMYRKLRSIYERDSNQQICTLLQEFFNYTYNSGTDMATHISHLESLSHKLKSLNKTVDEAMVISKILATLPNQYGHFISAWESTMERERTLTNLTARLIAEEARLTTGDKNVVAFKSSEVRCYRCKCIGHVSKQCRTSEERIIKCFRCNKLGHIARYCPQQKIINNMSCKICKKTNHTEKDCFFRNTNNTKKMSFIVGEHNKNEEKQSWILDSGSSSHMANSKEAFDEIEEININIGTAKKSTSLEAKGVGTIKLIECSLKKVLYVPDLSKNLLSVSAITENGGEVKFRRNKVVILKNNKKILEGVKNDQGLYNVYFENNIDKYKTFLTQKIEAVKWHQRLGHLGYNNMKRLLSITKGMNITNKEIEKLDKVCEICLRARQLRFPFKTERSRASRPLEIIHTDVLGPIDPMTWNGKRYVVTMLDDYTHFLMVYVIEHKK